MARNKKPNYLKIINGSKKHDPQRHKEDHLIPKPKNLIGSAPRCLSKEEKKIWNELKKIIPDGVVFDSDRVSLEMLCRLVFAIRNSDEIIASHYTQYISLASRFGLTPSDRQRVKIPEKPKPNGFDNV